ncbi:MAG: CapA family protein [Chlorobi bacterium]|nr:CapA family protein [Chlorobiota bacterium]
MKKIFLWVIWGWVWTAWAQDSLLVLYFTGDIMVHGPQLEAARRPGGSYDFNENFRHLQPWLASADLTTGNLETVLGVRPYSGYPRFSSPPELASALKAAGFDLLMTANNHALDKGALGVRRTVAVLDSLGLGHAGANADSPGSSPFLWVEKDGFKLAFLNYTYGTNGLPVPSGIRIPVIDTVRMRRDIEEARARRPDKIVVFLHWGNEYRLLPSEFQKRIENFLRRQGVDLIVGSHPHVVQPVRWDGRTLTAYSLGNFISNQRKFPRDGAFVLGVVLEKKNGRTRIARVGYLPFWTRKYIRNGRRVYENIPILPGRDLPEDMSEQERLRYRQFESFILPFMQRHAPGVERITRPGWPRRATSVFPDNR